MSEPSRPSIEIPMRVAFSDLDPMHVVWHGNYLKYFDAARFALFDALGVDLYRYSIEKRIAFPVTRQSTKHIVALGHNDPFICRAVITEAEYKIGMEFTIRRAGDNELCTRGNSEQVAVQVPEMELLFEIPEDIRAALGFLQPGGSDHERCRPGNRHQPKSPKQGRKQR